MEATKPLLLCVITRHRPARTDRPAETRDFFVELLGFEAVMDLGWVATVASPTNPSAQVTIIGNDDRVFAAHLGDHAFYPDLALTRFCRFFIDVQANAL